MSDKITNASGLKIAPELLPGLDFNNDKKVTTEEVQQAIKNDIVVLGARGTVQPNVVKLVAGRAELQAEVATLKAEVATLKAEVATLKVVETKANSAKGILTAAAQAWYDACNHRHRGGTPFCDSELSTRADRAANALFMARDILSR